MRSFFDFFINILIGRSPLLLISALSFFQRTPTALLWILDSSTLMFPSQNTSGSSLVLHLWKKPICSRNRLISKPINKTNMVLSQIWIQRRSRLQRAWNNKGFFTLNVIVFVSGTFDRFNVTCKQCHRTALHPFINGTKNDYLDGTCKRALKSRLTAERLTFQHFVDSSVYLPDYVDEELTSKRHFCHFNFQKKTTCAQK